MTTALLENSDGTINAETYEYLVETSFMAAGEPFMIVQSRGGFDWPILGGITELRANALVSTSEHWRTLRVVPVVPEIELDTVFYDADRVACRCCGGCENPLLVIYCGCEEDHV